MDVIYDRVRDILAASSLSGLMTLSDKPSIASVQGAQKLFEEKTDYLTRQFERFLNNVVNDEFDLNYQWDITVHSGIYTWRDDAKAIKELIILGGHKELIPRLLSYYDMTAEDAKGAQSLLDSLGLEFISDADQARLDADKAKLLANPVGRPKINDDEIQNENTGASRDAGTNVSEIKMSAKCPRCGNDLVEGEQYLCSACLEELWEDQQ